MLFNSLEFVVFFCVVLVVYALLGRHWTGRKVFLLACSYVFYMAWNPPYVLLLVLSTALDFWAGKYIAVTERVIVRRIWLGLSLIGNLGVLAFFKYADFLLSSFWVFLPAAEYPEWVRQIILPMGISFYTFQSMSYTIDVYRHKGAQARSFLDFALYVTFFPQLVAGPIIRSQDFLPQLVSNRSVTNDDIAFGLDRIFRGFAKKVILADTLARYVDLVYANPGEFGAVNHALAIYAYAYQIYFDFSGYSDIAVGSARMLGFRVPENFNLPYLSRGPSDFWTRWHISLSSWLRDYLYISLGGSRFSRWLTYRNLFITMLLGGLWHGAAWNFVLWGAFHGLWLAIHRWLFRDRAGIRIPAFVSVIATFHLVCVGWVLFRAQSVEAIGAVFRQFTDFSTPIYLLPVDIAACLAAGLAAHLLGGVPAMQRLWARTAMPFKVIWYVIVTVLIVLTASTTSSFIYFQF